MRLVHRLGINSKESLLCRHTTQRRSRAGGVAAKITVLETGTMQLVPVRLGFNSKESLLCRHTTQRRSRAGGGVTALVRFAIMSVKSLLCRRMLTLFPQRVVVVVVVVFDGAAGETAGDFDCCRVVP
jgi:hypothetical protein